MQSIINYIKHPLRLLDALVHYFGQWLPDRIYIKIRYRCNTGKYLNLKDPQTFQEKLQWLKLYDRNPEYTRLVDKLLVKEYVASKLGEKYVIPLLGVWNSPEDIDWDALPDKFVLKTNHAGGNTGVVICCDNKNLDKKSVITKLKISLKNDIYHNYREWPYKDVKKKIFAEAFIETEQNNKDLIDYKWYCFNGEPLYCQVIQGRTQKETIDFFDTKWHHQEFVGLNPAVGNSEIPPSPPLYLKEQIAIAKTLSQGIPFSRIDLYEANDKIYFGEITLYPFSGYGTFTPERFNLLIGHMLVLPKD